MTEKNERQGVTFGGDYQQDLRGGQGRRKKMQLSKKEERKKTKDLKASWMLLKY